MARILAINSGPGPGNGLIPLDESAADCAPGEKFPLTTSDPQEEAGIGTSDTPIPGLLQICYRGSAFFSYLVVHGPAYGTVWELHDDLIPTGLTFADWYRVWTNMLIEHAIPRLANEALIADIASGMTRAQILKICGAVWRETSLRPDYSILSFRCLSTAFEFDNSDILVRIIRHNIY